MIAEGYCALVSGALGSGKSLYGAERIIQHLALGGTCITNMQMVEEQIKVTLRKQFGVVYDPSRLVQIDPDSIKNFHDFARRGGARLPVLMVLDEAALDHNARNWRDRTEEAFHMVVLCRKLGIMLLFIAQDAEDLDSQLRRKFAEEISCRSLSKLLLLENGRHIGLPLFVRVRLTDKMGKVRGQGKHRLGWSIRWGSPAFGCYLTHALHGAKGKLFGALQEAEDKPLQKIPYDYTTANIYLSLILALIIIFL